MSEQVSITIKLCNRTYRIKVVAENEAKVRTIMHSITEKMSNMKKDFPGRDDHDYMAMTLIDHITASGSEQQSNTDTEELSTRLKAINNLFDA